MITITSASVSGNTVTLNFAALPEDVYRLTVKDTITDVATNALDGDRNDTPRGVWRCDLVVNAFGDVALDSSFNGDGKLTTAIGTSNDYGNSVVIQSDGKIVVAGNSYNGINDDFAVIRLRTTGSSAELASANGLVFDVDKQQFGTGELLQGPLNAFDGLNRMLVGSSHLSPTVAATTIDGGQSVQSSVTTISGLDVQRKVSVPMTGSQDFARTVDDFTNNTASAITTPVTIVGNLGSDAATTVFATSDGDNIVEPTDWWFGTDDGDGTGTPAIIHLLHGPGGLIPASVNVIEDNVEWTYNLTIGAGETKRLAEFTVLGTTRVQAIIAVNALFTSNGFGISGFGGEAAAFLTAGELTSLANFQFNSPPTNISLSSSSVAENSIATSVVGTLSASRSDPLSTVIALVPGALDNNKFSLTGNVLATNQSFDYEANSYYVVRVTATSAGVNNVFYDASERLSFFMKARIRTRGTAKVGSNDDSRNLRRFLPFPSMAF